MKKILLFVLIMSSLSNQQAYGEKTSLQKLEVATALLQAPILLSATTINTEASSTTSKHKLKLVTTIARLANSSLSLYNKNQLNNEGYSLDKYLLAWGTHDLIKLATTIHALIKNETNTMIISI